MPNPIKPLTDEQLAARVKREKELHEYGLNRTVIERLTRFLKNDPASQARDALIREVIARGQHGIVVELGTKTWQHLVNFEHTPPRQLICLNIALAEVQRHSHRAIPPAHAHRIAFTVMDAHQIALPNQSADVIYGTAILHHLDLASSIREIDRVLKPGGVAVFAEPLRDNPVLRLIRAATPQARTPDELPFSHPELAHFAEYFHVEYHYSQLLSVPTAVLSGLLLGSSDTPLVRATHRLDQAIATHLPALQTWFRIVTLVLHKPPSPNAKGGTADG